MYRPGLVRDLRTVLLAMEKDAPGITVFAAVGKLTAHLVATDTPAARLQAKEARRCSCGIAMLYQKVNNCKASRVPGGWKGVWFCPGCGYEEWVK